MQDRRRKHPRVSSELDILLFREGKEVSSGLVLNLSSHGFMARLHKRIEAGPVEFKLEIPDASIKGPGEVMWTHEERTGFMVGVRMSPLKKRDQRRIRRLINPRELDKVKAFWLALGGVFCGLLVGLTEDLLTKDPALRQVMIEQIPNALALGIMGVSVIAFFKVDD
jgi:hypothetical protein